MGTESASKKKVLVVDDEPNVVTYLETVLQDGGYETVSARDGQEALEKIRREQPDLVTLDISMPEKSGVRFYREVKADTQLSRIPIVVVTAVTGYGGKPEEFQKFLSTRKQIPAPEAFIPKPIEPDEFLSVIGQLIK